jgi:hypothetical protein
MTIKTKQLIEVLEELIAVLEMADQPHWHDWMREAKTKLIADDPTGIAKILSAYGGMGSFTDLVVGWKDTPTGPVWDQAGTGQGLVAVANSSLGIDRRTPQARA